MTEVMRSLEHLIQTHHPADRQTYGNAHRTPASGGGKAGKGHEREAAAGVTGRKSASALFGMVIHRIAFKNSHVRREASIMSDLVRCKNIGGSFANADEKGR